MLLEYKEKLPQGGKVQDIVKKISDHLNDFNSSTTSKQESIDFINTITKMIENNPEFGQYKLVDIKRGSDVAPIATFQNGDDVVVAFWGTTGAKEWKDNVIGGIEENGTKSQQEALEYIEHIKNDLGLTGITTTGHSKGANKAQYVAIMSEVVDECICYDGQGFSVDFYEKHKEAIEKNKDKITVISSEYDVVNAMLIDIAGTRLYVDCSDVPQYYLTDGNGNTQFFYYHKPAVLLNENGELRKTDGVKPAPIARLVYDYSTYMTRIEDKTIRNQMFSFVAEIVSEVLDPNNTNETSIKIKSVLDKFIELDNTEVTAGFVTYLIDFLNEENLRLDDFVNILSDAGFDISSINTESNFDLWEMGLSIERNLGPEKVVDIFLSLSEWGKDNNCSTWNEVIAQADKLLLDFNNSENLALLLSQVFEFCEDYQLNYNQFLGIVKDYGINSDFLDSEYAPILWDALFDASREMSSDEFVALVNSITEWSKKKGLDSWDQLLDYIKDDPLRLLELYEYCGADKEAFNRAIIKLFSPDNIASLLGVYAKKHPIIAGAITAATINPFTRHIIESIGVAVTVVGTIYLIANHIIKNWDRIVSDIKRTVEEIKEKVGEFFSEIIEKVKSGIEKYISIVVSKAIEFVGKVKNVVNSAINGAKAWLHSVKESAIKGINKVLNFSRGVVYRISSRLFGARKEPVRIDYRRLRDCVDRMNAISRRVSIIDRRLDSLYLKLLAKDIEQEEGVLTSIVNMYNLIRADIAVDEGTSIKRKAQAISSLFGDYNGLERRIKGCVPSKLR
jgi:hypothetical protein